MGTLALGGLSLADLLRLETHGADAGAGSPKSVIFVYLPDGPSHIDLYDMKPDASVEIRGAFRPIRTTVSSHHGRGVRNQFHALTTRGLLTGPTSGLTARDCRPG